MTERYTVIIRMIPDIKMGSDESPVTNVYCIKMSRMRGMLLLIFPALRWAAMIAMLLMFPALRWAAMRAMLLMFHLMRTTR